MTIRFIGSMLCRGLVVAGAVILMATVVNAQSRVGATGQPGPAEINGHPDSKVGGSEGLQIKNIPTGPGDDIKAAKTGAALTPAAPKPGAARSRVGIATGPVLRAAPKRGSTDARK